MAYFSLENHFFLIILNAVVYSSLLTFFFCVFFLFDFRIFRTLNEYKFFRTTGFINTTVIILLLSMAGIPPLMGFLAKVFIFYLLFLTKYYIIIICMIIFNLFVMYFYIQNIRFIYSKSAPNIYVYFKYKVNMNFPLIAILSLGLFFNLGGIFFFEYIITLLHQTTFFIKIF